MTKPFMTFASPLFDHRADRAFFLSHPFRRFLARAFVTGDLPLSTSVVPFGDDGSGGLLALNLVVVKSIKGGRKRICFAVGAYPPLSRDLEIVSFLQSRGIDAETMELRAGG